MADSLIAALVARPIPHEIEHLYLTDSVLDWGRIDGVMFSGGVAEYVYDRETARLRRHGPPARRTRSRAGSTAARCRGRCWRRANASARPRWARRSIQRPALRQHLLHLQPRQAAAAAQPAGDPAAVRVHRRDRSRPRSRRPIKAASQDVRGRGRRARDRAVVPLEGRPAYERIARSPGASSPASTT